MKISILGCGWLGFPLAKHLIEKGYGVKGSTTSEEKLSSLKEAGIDPCLIKLTPAIENSDEISSFWDSDILVLNIPSRTKYVDIIEYHPRQIQSVTEAVEHSSIKRIVFISSTSVYPPLSGKVKEDDAARGKARRDSGEALLIAEDMLLNSATFKTTVLRFGGLIGENRNPVTYLAGKKDMSRANAPVNLIHRNDCIAIITQIIEDNINGEILNAVCDDHPTRKEYYRKQAKKLNLEPPRFKSDTEKGYKVVSNEKLKKMLDYSFKLNDL